MTTPRLFALFLFAAFAVLCLVVCAPCQQMADQWQTVQSSATAQASAEYPFCRVWINDRWGGSGVLVDVRDGRGLVLTNEHVARGARSLVCKFLNGEVCRGRYIAPDKFHNDLAALDIETPNNIDPIGKIAHFTGQGFFTLYGFGGGDGLNNFRRVTGRFMHLGVASGHLQGRVASDRPAQFSFPVRSGDSGSAVIDETGALVGITWGWQGQQRYGACTVGAPMIEFLGRLCRNCPPGGCDPYWNPSPHLERIIWPDHRPPTPNGGRDPRREPNLPAPREPDPQPEPEPELVRESDLDDLRRQIDELLGRRDEAPIIPPEPPTASPPVVQPPSLDDEVVGVLQNRINELTARLAELEGRFVPNENGEYDRMPMVSAEWEMLDGKRLLQSRYLSDPYPDAVTGGDRLKFKTIIPEN